MSSNIEPVGTDEFDGTTIREYDLPEGEDPPLIWVDTSVDGYSAEWVVGFDAENFEEFLSEYASPEGEETVATVAPEPPDGYKLRGSFEEVTSDDDYHSGDCTYFQLRTDAFHIGWEEWGGEYKLVLTVGNSDTAPLDWFLYHSLGWDSNLSASQESTIDWAVSEADEVIRRDYDREE